MFQFKQFTINDDRCAMKVGTDGVLLGAWANVDHASRVLDVGAGCGLIALMLAQRFPQIRVTALELDAEAAEQARDNVEKSPFSSQIEVVQGDFSLYSSGPFDAIVSNPPFFEEDLLPPDAARANARHTSSALNFENLVVGSVRLLVDGGTLSVIIPKNAQNRFHSICNKHGLTLLRATDVRTVVRKAPKRVMLHFAKCPNAASAVVRDEIILMEDGKRSAAYTHLCREFYL